MMPRPIIPGRVSCVPALLLLVVAFAVNATAEDWPGVDLGPIPHALIPEAVNPDEAAARSAIDADLRDILFGGTKREPPSEPSPNLISWIIEIVSYAEPEELERFAASYKPSAWSSADAEGRLQLPVALALLEARRHHDALLWIEHGEPSEGDLAYRSLLRMEIYRSIGKIDRAVQVAAEIRTRFPNEDWTLPAARLLMDRLEEGDQFEALLKESLRTRDDLGRSRYETAARMKALTGLGHAEDAAAVGDTVLKRYVSLSAAKKEALRRFKDKTDTTDSSLLFPVFIAHDMYAEAESIIVRSEDANNMKLLLLERLLDARRYREILKKRFPLLGSPSDLMKARWFLVHARAARGSAMWDEMVRNYRQASLIPGSTRGVALKEWGREAESECRDALAESLYTAMMGIPERADAARFRRALARFAVGLYEDAYSDLKGLEREVGNGGAGFWKFRLAEIVGDTVSARSFLVAATEGEGYYGSRAQAELLQRANGAGGDRFWEVEDSLLFMSGEPGRTETSINCAGLEKYHRHAELIRAFRRFDRPAWAAREKRILEEVLPRAGRVTSFLCLGLPDIAVRVAIGAGVDSLLLRYPRPFAGLITKEAESAGISWELAWAVARRESLFDPGIVSKAGAVGLLQLMEKTAEATGDKWNIPSGPLRRVDINVPLGIKHLRDLCDSEDWPLPALLAAYNAGAAKAAEWVDRFHDPDLFIERIGWYETRGYVRHVLDGCWKYRAAYGADTGRSGSK